jgi:hypothetical protein
MAPTRDDEVELLVAAGARAASVVLLDDHSRAARGVNVDAERPHAERGAQRAPEQPAVGAGMGGEGR